MIRKRLDVAVVKSLSGGDTVTARHLYQGSFEFRPAFKLWLASTTSPKRLPTTRRSGGDFGRIPFAVTIPPEERDPDLRETPAQ